ncbi:MAG: ECF-type sigma factor [Pirellulales bacterium]
MSEVTIALQAINAGNSEAASHLLSLVYEELRRLAAAKMAQEKPGQTLDATGLVHEAYLRLVGDQRFENRGHFFAAAAEAMRRILVDRARERLSLKRGGGLERISIDDVPEELADQRLLELNGALTLLVSIDPLAAKVVELHHFVGMTQDAVAQALGLSGHKFRQKWAYARAWLKSELKNS